MDGSVFITLAATVAAGLAAVVCRELDRARPARQLPGVFLAALALSLGQAALVMDLAVLWASLAAGVAVILGLPVALPSPPSTHRTLLAALAVSLLAGLAYEAGGAGAHVASLAWLLPMAGPFRGGRRISCALLTSGAAAAAAGLGWSIASELATGGVALASMGMLAALLSRPLATALDLAEELERRDRESVRVARRTDVVAHFTARTAATLDPEVVLESGLDALVHWSGADLAGIALVREESQTLDLAAQRSVPKAILEELGRRPLPTDRGVISEVLHHGRPLLLDPATDPRMTRAFPAVDGWRSVLLAPLSAHDRALGAVCLVSRTPSSFGDEHLRTLAEIAEAMGLALDNAHAHARLDRQRRFSQQMIERAGVLVVAMDPALNLTLFNRTAELTLGRRAVDVLGRPGAETLVAPPDRERFRRLCLAQFGGRPTLAEAEVRGDSLDRSPHWHLWRFAVVPGDRERPAELVCFGIDVTEMRRGREALDAMSAEALRARERAEEALSELREARDQLRRAAAGAPPEGQTLDDPPPLTLVQAPAPFGDADAMPRVLAVDDEESVLDIVREALSRSGFRVDTAQDGETALRMLGERGYDLLLSDIRMPGVGGPELYEVLRRRWPDLADRTLFLTGDTVSDHARSFLEATGVDYLEKPFEITELLAAVHRTAGRGNHGTSGSRA